LLGVGVWIIAHSIGYVTYSPTFFAISSSIGLSLTYIGVYLYIRWVERGMELDNILAAIGVGLLVISAAVTLLRTVILSKALRKEEAQAQ